MSDNDADQHVVYTRRRKAQPQHGQKRPKRRRPGKVRELDAEAAERLRAALLELGVGKATPWTADEGGQR